MRGCMTSPICSSDPRNPRSIIAGGLTNLPIRDTLPWYWARRVPRLLRAKARGGSVVAPILALAAALLALALLATRPR
jgi:hypothetical protein